MKQYNIFGDFDFLDDEGNVRRCCICNKSIEKGQLCTDEKCGETWAEKYLSINALHN